MASTYTTRIRLEKQGDGENPNSWGDILNQKDRDWETIFSFSF